MLILGATRGELGGSAYWAEIREFVGGRPPPVDLERGARGSSSSSWRRPRRGCSARRTTASEGGLAGGARRGGDRRTLRRARDWAPSSTWRATRPAWRPEGCCTVRTPAGWCCPLAPRPLARPRRRSHASTACRCFRAGRVGGPVRPGTAARGLACSAGTWRHLRRTYFEAIPRRMQHAGCGALGGRIDGMCGIIGVSGIPDAARLTYLGLYALQHRGQESAGIVAIDRGGQRARRTAAWGSSRRPSTTTSSTSCPATSPWATPATPPPAAPCSPTRSRAASTPAAAPSPSPTTATSPTPPSSSASWSSKGAIFTTSSDTEVLVHLIARSEAETVEGQIRDALEQVEGAYSLVIAVGPHALRRGGQPRLPPAGPGPAGRRHGGGLGDLRARPGRRHDRLRARAGRLRPDRRRAGHRAAPALAPAGEPLRLRAGLLRAARQHGVRRVGGPGAPRARPPARPRAARATRRRGVQRARQLQRHGARLLRGVGHQARARAHPQPLRGPHLHQPDPGPPGGQGEDQVQPGARRDRRQVGASWWTTAWFAATPAGAWCR